MDNGASSYRRFRDEGDENGLAEIIKNYKDGLILYLNSFVGNIQVAEELAEDTFVLLGTKKPKDKGKGSFKTWLYTIGRNIAIDYLRKNSKRKEISFDECSEKSNVKQIEITNASNYGQIDVFGTKEDTDNYRFPHGKALIIKKEQITENLSFSWNHTEIDSYLKEHQNPSYKDFNDTFNFTVEYDDGRKVTASIDIVFNDSGEATVICNGYKLIAV